ncbi:MAG: hypothetical protein PHH49_08775, partial [Candidatus Omnitrophica bacterium]|nr:hypothetical protein [Candidatus Omnitrophota bacterium]MDD5489033.1 hypothetical protein [Candidatus Omnitrophota bacterium]
FLYLHGDLVYDEGILSKCMAGKGDIVLAVDRKECDEEDMKVRVTDGRFVESSKHIALSEAYGEWIGIARFSPRGGEEMFGEINDVVREGVVDAYDTYAFTRLAGKGNDISICHTDGLPWVEVDFMEELNEAERIERDIRKGKA